MQFSRDLLVTQLRADGKRDVAERAKLYLPEVVSREEHQQVFDYLGIDDDTLLKIPYALPPRPVTSRARPEESSSGAASP